MYRKRKYTKNPKFSKDKEKFTRRQKDGMIIRCKPQDIFQRLNIPNYIKEQNTIDMLKANPTFGLLTYTRSLQWDFTPDENPKTAHIHPKNILSVFPTSEINQLKDNFKYVLIYNLLSVHCYNISDNVFGIDVTLNTLPDTYNRQNIKSYGLSVYERDKVIEHIIDADEIGYQTIISNSPGYTFKLAQYSFHGTGADIKKLYTDESTVIPQVLIIVTAPGPNITRLTMVGEMFLYPEE